MKLVSLFSEFLLIFFNLSALNHLLSESVALNREQTLDLQSQIKMFLLFQDELSLTAAAQTL